MKPDFDVICYGSSIATYISAKKCIDAGMTVLLIDPSVSDSGGCGTNDSIIVPDGLDPEDLNDLNISGVDYKNVFDPVKISFADLKVRSNSVFAIDEYVDELIADVFMLSKKECKEFFDKVRTVTLAYRNRYQLTGSEIKYFNKIKFGKIRVGQLIGESSPYNAEKNTRIANEYENIVKSLIMSDSHADPLYISHEHLFRMIVILRGKRLKLQGGISGLKLKYLDAIKSSKGSNVKSATDIQSLYSENGDVKGVLLNTFDGVIRSDSVILCANYARMYKTVPDGVKKNETLSRLRKVEKRHSRLKLNYKIETSLLNLKSSNLIWLKDYFNGKDSEYNAILRHMSDGEYTNIEIITYYPVSSSNFNVDILKRYISRLSHTLISIAPFAEKQIIEQTTDWIGNSKFLKNTLHEIYNNEELSYYYIQGSKRNSPGFLGLHWITGNRGLYFAGKAVFPAYGFYGEYLSALKAVEDIQKSRMIR